MDRQQFRELKNFFGGEIEVTHTTFSTEYTLTGPIDLYQIQIDTFSTEQTNTSVRAAIGGTDIKRRGFSTPGTAEISFVGRNARVASDSHLFLDRPDGDEHELFVTIIYRGPPPTATPVI